MAGLHLPKIKSLEDLAIPAACLNISFLAYSSQYLFHYIDPGPLSTRDAIWFNTFISTVWWCYYRACTTDPGPKEWVETLIREENGEDEDAKEVEALWAAKGMRWCRKCNTIKLPRAHHCSQCGRCIPKMDHHCPWTRNCVSHTTFPHFIRFILYSVLSMSLLDYHLSKCIMVLWESRNLPAYLGPPAWTMAYLLVLLLLNNISLFALSILLIRSLYSLAINTTMIESWEIERHEVLVERSKEMGGYVYGHGGQKIRIERQEFPYDIRFWANICQGMGSNSVLMWFMPFSGTPGRTVAVDYETNGFEDKEKLWPPSDPEKLPRKMPAPREERQIQEYETVGEEIAAFKQRQSEDYQKGNLYKPGVPENDKSDDYESEYEEGMDGEVGWTNSEGDRLRDYGVDEEAEVLADDEVPLGELLRRRKGRAYNE